MARYKLIKNGVRDTEAKRVIPENLRNKHWQEYLEWLAEGNTPDLQYNLPELKANKKQEIRQEALKRVQILYPALTDIDMISLVQDIISSIAPTARNVHPDLQAIGNIVKAAKAGIQAVNSFMTDAEVIGYNVETDPSWP